MVSSIRKNNGYTLIEILVSIFVLSVGILGIAMMQTQSMRYNHDSRLYTIALNQAHVMIDKMRANRAGISSGSYNALDENTSAPSCSGSCTPAQAAALDYIEWNTNNSALLPAGTGQLTVNGNITTIQVMWDKNRTGATGTACSGNPTVDLTCLTISVQL